uniref:G-protein coupled receptors family 1 profile domain-containing protein n=1 Tax=Scylla olivacea TaxID=85551 RepID=A0A0P4WLQ5_SCYOL
MSVVSRTGPVTHAPQPSLGSRATMPPGMDQGEDVYADSLWEASPSPALRDSLLQPYVKQVVLSGAEYVDHTLEAEMEHGILCSNSSEVNGSASSSVHIPESLTDINMTQLIAYSLLFPLAAVGNLLVFVALFRNRHRKSRVNMMILHLSLADMIVTFVFLPTEITWHVTIEWVFGNFGCKVYKFLSAFGFYMSSMVLVCISLDRYFAVLHPLKVNDAQRRGKIMLFFAWLISAVISLPQIGIGSGPRRFAGGR